MQVYGEVEKVHKHPNSSKALIFLAHLTRKKKKRSVSFLIVFSLRPLKWVWWRSDPWTLRTFLWHVSLKSLCRVPLNLKYQSHVTSVFPSFSPCMTYDDVLEPGLKGVRSRKHLIFLNPVYKNDSQVFSSARAHTQVNAWTGGAAGS